MLESLQQRGVRGTLNEQLAHVGHPHPPSR